MAAKKYEEMDDHELMLEMVKMQKKDAMGQKLTAYATIAIFVCGSYSTSYDRAKGYYSVR